MLNTPFQKWLHYLLKCSTQAPEQSGGDRCNRGTATLLQKPFGLDQQVYALYGLTPEEIKIVEAASA
jgi:hypothetical protein